MPWGVTPQVGTKKGTLRKEEQIIRQALVPYPKTGFIADTPFHLGSIPQGSWLSHHFYHILLCVVTAHLHNNRG